MTFNPSRTYEAVELGNRTSLPDDVRPHKVLVWNNSVTTRAVTVHVSTDTGVVLDQRYEIPADAAVTIVLQEVDTYTVTLRTVDSDTGTTIQVQKERFDCNASATQVTITEDGEFESRVVTTWLECGSSVTFPDDMNRSDSNDTVE